MADLKVNVDAVIGCANKIKGFNNEMNTNFSDVQSAMTRLDRCWDGSAATNAMTKFNSLKNTYCTARYNVLDNFVAFLYEQVGEGYTQTEDVNKALADAFK